MDRSPFLGYQTWWDRDSKIWRCAHNCTLPTEPLVSAVSEQALELVTDCYTRTILALGGRRSGKSYAAAQKIAVLVLLFPGRPGLVLSPSYRQARNVFRAILRVVPRNWLHPGTLGIQWCNELKELRFVNGATVSFRSADREEGCRSDGAAWLLADEWQDISDQAYMNAHMSLSEGGNDYLVVLTATIKQGLRERHDRLLELSRSSVGLAKILRMRSRGNPFIGHALFDEAERFLDTVQVQQEIEAQWPELTGRIYWAFDSDSGVVQFPAQGRTDATALTLHERFASPPPYSAGAHQWYVSVDPPHSAAVWKIYDDGTLHLVHEVVLEADGTPGDVRTLAARCRAICGAHGGVVVRDPHDTGYAADMAKYFRAAGFRMAAVRRMPVEYRLTSVRSACEHRQVLVSPTCHHALDILSNHKYADGKPGQPDKAQRYTRAHERNSTAIQMVHLSDAIGYGVYKLRPARYEYEKNEKLMAA